MTDMRHLCARLVLLCTLLAVLASSLAMAVPAQAAPGAAMADAAAVHDKVMAHGGAGCPSAGMTGKDSHPGQDHCAKAMCCFHHSAPPHPAHLATLRQTDFGGRSDMPVRERDPKLHDKPPKHT